MLCDGAATRLPGYLLASGLLDIAHPAVLRWCVSLTSNMGATITPGDDIVVTPAAPLLRGVKRPGGIHGVALPEDVRLELKPGNYRYIAHAAGISLGHVSRVLNGRRGANIYVAKRIADAANVTLDELFEHISSRPRHNRNRKTIAELTSEAAHRYRMKRRRSKIALKGRTRNEGASKVVR